MSCKVYVGGLPWACNADELKQVCSKYGAVEDGKMAFKHIICFMKFAFLL